ncbi:hypothetical protein JGU66_34625 [Myxococcaceae bacterium JPH2]|nr:hypothetical protein [Myxococcaceae bacterium JPH2]
MNKLVLTTYIAAALTLAGCGSDRLATHPDGSPEETEVIPGQRFELRLRGTSTEGYDKLEVPIRDISVTGNGSPIRVQLAQHQVDLANSDHAPLVGYFYVPDGVERVRVTLQLQGLGEYTQGEKVGAIDARVAPIHFDAPVRELAQRGRAVVQLDVARSLIVKGEHRLLLPNGVVNY